ncbi:MAG: 23S rRNA pseudouridine(955/2504/2580) synthase, partial [Plesiomonas sp.]
EHATLVKASPITGRTHQIRVHTLHAGHPIAFDDKYGDRDFDATLAGSGLNRLFLHAAAIRFRHPQTGNEMTIEAPLDPVLKNAVMRLRDKRTEY